MRRSTSQAKGDLTAEIARLKADQENLLAALQLLLNLLEEYAPSRYTEEHHNTAFAALRRLRMHMNSGQCD